MELIHEKSEKAILIVNKNIMKRIIDKFPYWAKVTIGSLTVLLIAVALSSSALAANISSELDYGESGADVRALQEFLATNSLIYPAGLVTGYYGPLTRDAVVQFQIAYGISPVGRVGPVTMAKINSLMNAGLGLDTSATGMSNVSVQTSSNSATLQFTTNELARVKAYYDNKPLTMYETMMDPIISGSVVEDTGFSTSHSIILPNLSSSTRYYFVVKVIDRSGNVTVSSFPASTFVTN